MGNIIINARRTNQLGNDDTFCAVNHKGSCSRHQGKITHENLMLGNLILLFIMKAHLHLKGCCIGGIPFLAFLDAVFDFILAELEIHKFQTQLPAIVFNGRDVIEGFL